MSAPLNIRYLILLGIKENALDNITGDNYIEDGLPNLVSIQPESLDQLNSSQFPAILLFDGDEDSWEDPIEESTDVLTEKRFMDVEIICYYKTKTRADIVQNLNALISNVKKAIHENRTSIHNNLMFIRPQEIEVSYGDVFAIAKLNYLVYYYYEGDGT